MAVGSLQKVKPRRGKEARNAFLSVSLLVVLLAVLVPRAALGGTPTTSVVESDARAAKVVYLTFDDGPAALWTGRVLDLLKRHRAKATFFAVGSQLAAYPRIARRIAREGHVIANHTYTHADLTRVSDGRFFSELDHTQALIRRFTGAATHWLRPPYGAVNARVRSLASRRAYRVALWDVDPQDWRRPGVSSIVRNVLANTGPGDVVLLHDGGGERSQTVAALARVLKTLRARGYTFRALP